jgi:hypothetical protein
MVYLMAVEFLLTSSTFLLLLEIILPSVSNRQVSLIERFLLPEDHELVLITLLEVLAEPHHWHRCQQPKLAQHTITRLYHKY